MTLLSRWRERADGCVALSDSGDQVAVTVCDGFAHKSPLAGRCYTLTHHADCASAVSEIPVCGRFSS
jgi:hypothetical protein